MSSVLDALVIGGGPGGATAALLLARAGWNVAVLERKVFPRRKVCGEYLSATNLPLLERLGIAEVFRNSAGPEVHQVGLFAGKTIARADLPYARAAGGGWGRALSRERLDTLLLARAARAGAVVLQPYGAYSVTKDGPHYNCQAKALHGGESLTLSARIIVAAHGSWEPGSLPTQSQRAVARPADLLGFKAHFCHSDLPLGLMPLLAFPGGYGGMVHCDGGRVSLSCCLRRDALGELRLRHGGSAGDAVLAHIQESCLGAQRALAGAVREGDWLAAGPIRPGIRLRAPLGIFPVGNAAGEAHPVIAEGISMAIQSAWLLATRLIAWRAGTQRRSDLAKVGKAYAEAWRQSFASRLYASSAVAHWAMCPLAVSGSLPLVRTFPGLLSWGAHWSGKATQVVDLCV